MRRASPALLAIAAIAFAGCLTPADIASPTADDAPQGGPYAAIRDLLQGLPCEASSVGAGTSDNLKPLAMLPHDGNMHGELDHFGDLMISARYQKGGFELMSIADPLHPALLSTFEDMKPSGLDAKFSPDGRSVLVGNQQGITVVDVTNPQAPVKASEWRFPSAPPTDTLGQNAHMLYARHIGDADWVFLAPNSNTGVWILKLTGEPSNRSLEYVTRVGAPLGGGPIGPHDMWVGIDALTNATFLYVANGFEGWLVYNVDDPAKPALLGGTPNADPNQEYTHTIMATKLGNRRIVATVGEVGVNAIKVYDATNLRAPLLLASWMSDAAKPTLPNHNLQIVGPYLYVAHYEKGVYVFNLSSLPALPYAGLYQMKPMAHYAEGTQASAPTSPIPFTHYYDVVVKDGIVYANNMNEGMHVIGFGCLTPGDPAATSLA